MSASCVTSLVIGNNFLFMFILCKILKYVVVMVIFMILYDDVYVFYLYDFAFASRFVLVFVLRFGVFVSFAFFCLF